MFVFSMLLKYQIFQIKEVGEFRIKIYRYNGKWVNFGVFLATMLIGEIFP